MHHKTLLTVLACLLVGSLISIALAAPSAPNPQEVGAEQRFRRGIVIGNNQVGTKLSNVTKGTLDYDFQALGDVLVCAESGAITVNGARFGDPCIVGVDQALVNAFGTLDAYITAADTAKVRACATGITDGGSFDQPDSGYTVRCFAL